MMKAIINKLLNKLLIMPYLSNPGQLGESWTTNLAWRSGDLSMPRGLKLINYIVCNKYYMFREIFQ
jgi:hypothetical protein